MKRHWKILIAVAGVVIVAILGPVIHHYQLRSATNAYIAELKAKGEPMDVAQVIPSPVPPDQNSADTFRKAAALFKENHSLLITNTYYCMIMVAPGKAAVCSQLSDARNFNLTNSWAEVAAAVAQNSASIELLHTIIEKPTFDFGIHYEQGLGNLNFTNLCLSESKQAALTLEAAALSDLHLGDTVSATKDLRAMLAIVEGMRNERLAISELVRIAIAQIALPVNWEILQSTNLTDEQLAALQNDWTTLEFFRAEENALEMERASGEITVAQLRRSSSELLRYTQWGELGLSSTKETVFGQAKLKSRILLWRYWWSYPDELTALKGYQVLLDAPRAAKTNSSLLPVQNALVNDLAKLSIPTNSSWFEDPNETDFHSLLSSSVTTLGRVFARTMKVETARQLTVAAIALKRYHLKHSKYPAELTALAPEFLSEIPHDPIDGQALRYRLNPDGTFLLYSVGDDGKDDGGDPIAEDSKKSIQWQRGRDWVWPQPATAKEIQDYYDKPPK